MLNTEFNPLFLHEDVPTIVYCPGDFGQVFVESRFHGLGPLGLSRGRWVLKVERSEELGGQYVIKSRLQENTAA